MFFSKLLNFFIIFSMILFASQASAGKTHIGTAETRSGACDRAEELAREAAKNSDLNGTCYRACTFENCKKSESGGEEFWSCTTESANHKGSCKKDSSMIRVNKKQ